MKFIILLMFLASPSFAQSMGERTGVDQMLDRAPTGSDVLLQLHQFNLFQESITDSSDKRGDDAVRKFASTQSDEAKKRDKQLTLLAKKTALNIKFPDEPSAALNNLLGGLDGSVGEAYVKGFYAAEISELQMAVSLLNRYTASSDDNGILAFARGQLPALEAALKEAQQAHPR